MAKTRFTQKKISKIIITTKDIIIIMEKNFFQKKIESKSFEKLEKQGIVR